MITCCSQGRLIDVLSWVKTTVSIHSVNVEGSLGVKRDSWGRWDTVLAYLCHMYKDSGCHPCTPSFPWGEVKNHDSTDPAEELWWALYTCLLCHTADSSSAHCSAQSHFILFQVLPAEVTLVTEYTYWRDTYWALICFFWRMFMYIFSKIFYGPNLFSNSDLCLTVEFFSWEIVSNLLQKGPCSCRLLIQPNGHSRLISFQQLFSLILDLLDGMSGIWGVHST